MKKPAFTLALVGASMTPIPAQNSIKRPYHNWATTLPICWNSWDSFGADDTKPTLDLTAGTLEFDTPEFTLKLIKASQTVAALQPKGANSFDFTPTDRLATRVQAGYHQHRTIQQAATNERSFHQVSKFMS